MKLALIVGHDEHSQGAINERSGLSEFEFNKALAHEIEYGLRGSSIICKIVFRTDYARLPLEVNNLKPDFIVSLHCNAYNTKASGTEVLYYHSSKIGRVMAELFQNSLLGALGLANRGVKPKHSEDRGGFLLRYTHAPCVICEPFFIDNDEDLDVAASRQHRLATSYVDAIKDIAEVIS